MSYDIELEGVNELIAKLDQIEKDIKDNFEKLLHDAAEIMKEAAEEKVSVDSGLLKEKIEIVTVELKAGKVRIGIGPTEKETFYWFFLEYGTEKMEAQPFLRPAFDENKKAVKEQIQNDLNDLLEKVSG